MKNITFIFIIILGSGACAPESKNNESGVIATIPPIIYEQAGPTTPPRQAPPQTRRGYGYEYPGSGCTTGNQRFHNRSRYCAGLRDETLNNYCAIDARYEDFKQYCRYSRWQGPR
ncbi:MAG: hypothetical protein IPM97_05120 [Bdellovibrionaceae bacterium]|nr:hypothetical protein [Pseudobdellovibrionaceae bacterium]